MDDETVEQPILIEPVVRDFDREVRTCVVCGAMMEDTGCKLRCSRPGCFYYAGCSDYL